ncbi:MAG TPA: nickel pincer cofactor biosynthesis protein LarC [Anaerolineae bacterium]|nr:nickel pincer cofactor biosynthesis protein LarC [Anaerolineae bacterium]
MKVAYFDCFAGASGDMILGALLDAGLRPDDLRERLSALRLPDWRLNVRRVVKGSVAATAVEIETEVEHIQRTLGDIEALITNSALPERDRTLALRIFRRLAEAEAQAHGVSPEEVHFHEVGAVDAIVDVVGAVSGLSLLGVERVHVSPLPLGRGFVLAAHGLLPLPGPAVVELLRGVPVVGREAEGETVTPTGAAILTTLAASYGAVPPFTIRYIGYGAGRQAADYPNVLRVLIGETEIEANVEWLVLLETNIDDLNPQVFDHVMNRLFGTGALDVWLTPVQMKKNRPGVLVSLLCRPVDETALVEILFRETTTLGLRRQMAERRSLPREIRIVSTRFGSARVKLALADGQVLRAIPEYEDCKQLAEANAVPLREVLAEVEQVARGGSYGNPDR